MKITSLTIAILLHNFCSKSEVHFSSRSEEHTSELQSRPHLVCRLLLEKKKKLFYKPFIIFFESGLRKSLSSKLKKIFLGVFMLISFTSRRISTLSVLACLLFFSVIVAKSSPEKNSNPLLYQFNQPVKFDELQVEHVFFF